MSGYLHRLLQTVLNPRETVHPRMGSLFAPHQSAPDPTTESFEQAETVATHPTRSDSFPPGEPTETVRHLAQSDESPLQRPAAANEPSRLFVSERPADVSLPGDDKAKPDTFAQAVQTPRPRGASRAQRAVPDSRRDAGIQSYMPLIQPRPTEPHSTKPDIPQFSTEVLRTREARANLTAQARPTRAEREPDEVQIHIGRIEVTAVQPPAPRAPKRRETAVSLDAYLERRNGRAR
jgi:hypothetical protein